MYDDDEFSDFDIIFEENKLNDNKKTMAQCNKCGLRLKNLTINFKKHRRFCKFQSKFKYVYPTKSKYIIKSFCTICSQTLNTISPSRLDEHREKCVDTEKIKVKVKLSFEENVKPNVNETDDVDESNQETLQQPNNGHDLPDSTMKTELIEIPQIKKIKSEKEFEKDAVKKEFTSMRENMISHRRHCRLKGINGDILITTSTQPTEPSKFCFICNVSVSNTIETVRRYVNMYETESNFSKVPIFDLVTQFLSNKQSSRNLIDETSKSKWDCVCLECYKNLTAYDEVSLHLQKIKEKITKQLRITQLCVQHQKDSILKNVEIGDEYSDHDSDIEIIENDEEPIVIETDSSDDGEMDVQNKHDDAIKKPAEQLVKDVHPSDVSKMNTQNGHAANKTPVKQLNNVIHPSDGRQINIQSENPVGNSSVNDGTVVPVLQKNVFL